MYLYKVEEDIFRTINVSAEGLITEKKSKFLSFIHHVESAEKAKEIVEECRKKYYDARHVCWAYMLGPQRDDFRSNDDGEPSGTAGRPILGQINSYELTDVIVLVVRYFGGTLLGTSGLIKAYKEAASEAIGNAEIIEKTVHWEQDFKESCIMRLMIRKSQIDQLTNALAAIYGVEIKTPE